MPICCGCTVALNTFGLTPMTLLLNVRPDRQPDLRSREVIPYDPPMEARRLRASFGNVATRILAPSSRITMLADFETEDHARPGAYAPEAGQIPVQDPPDEALPFLLGSRYFDTGKLSPTAWNQFGGTRSHRPPGTSSGHARRGAGRDVQVIVDYVPGRLRSDYMQADAIRSAFDGQSKQVPSLPQPRPSPRAATSPPGSALRRASGRPGASRSLARSRRWANARSGACSLSAAVQSCIRQVDMARGRDRGWNRCWRVSRACW